MYLSSWNTDQGQLINKTKVLPNLSRRVWTMWWWQALPSPVAQRVAAAGGFAAAMQGVGDPH